MKNEPLGLALFRYFLSFVFVAFVAMLYWSSVIQEESLKEIKKELKTLHAMIHENGSSVKNTVTVSAPVREAQKPVSEEYPNLLTSDPFYEKTLATLLPEDFVPNGTRREAAVGKPDNLHPFSNWGNVSGWHSMCSVSLAKLAFGRFETFTPNMATKIEERPSANGKGNEYWIALRNDVYWSPLNPAHFPEDLKLAAQFLEKNQVTAHDYKFRFDVLMNSFVQDAGAVSERTYLSDIEEFRVIDDFTFVVRWKLHDIVDEKGEKKQLQKYTAKQLTGSLRPLPRWVFQYFSDGTKIVEEDAVPDAYRTNSVFAQNFSQHWTRNVIVSCGPWIFDGMSDRQIAFKRNPEHYDQKAVLVNRLEIEFKEAPDAVWQDFKEGKLDTYQLRPDELLELSTFLKSPEYKKQEESGLKIHRLDFLAYAYNYLGWNEKTAWFKSKKVRQAMTMAIDRNRIIDNNLNGMGEEITGPFFKKSPSYDPAIKAWEFNPLKARSLLSEEGWFDSDADGIINKMIDGKSVPFRFKIAYYVKNPTSKSNSEYISTALKAVGVDAELNGVDIADLSAMFDDKNFDAIYLGWGLGTPPEDPRQLWYSSGANEKGSSNGVSFSNAEADKIIDELQYEYDIAKRNQLYHRFHQIIHEEAPYTFLYTPKSVFLYRDYVKNVFIPSERQDLVPGADISAPDSGIFWLSDHAD